MSGGEPVRYNAEAFSPNDGGYGVRFSVTATAASTPVGIPGSGGAPQSNGLLRARVAVSGDYSACVRFGTGDRADTNCMEVLAGTVEMFTIPFLSGGLTVSAICPISGGSTTVSVVVGRGF